jgi:dTDP-4-dehydrorhamnose reductase
VHAGREWVVVRLLVTGVSGLIGSNLAAAAAQQSWRVLGTWGEQAVSLPGAHTAHLELADRHACVALAERFEPDVVVHAAGGVQLSRLEHEPYLAQLHQLATEHTLAAAREVRAHYVLVSCDWVFSGYRPPGQCWDERDPTEPVNAYGRSRIACEQTVSDWRGSWLITRPADVYGVNLSIPVPREEGPSVGECLGVSEMGPNGGFSRGRPTNGFGPAVRKRSSETRVRQAWRKARTRHVWRRSGAALALVARLRAGEPLPAPVGVHRSPTYAWDYAQCVCELLAQECEGIYNTAGPVSLGRHEHLRLLAQAFGCDAELVRDGTVAAYLRACGEDIHLKLPPNTALCDAQTSFVLGRKAVDPSTGHALMREQLRRALEPTDPAAGAPTGGERERWDAPRRSCSRSPSRFPRRPREASRPSGITVASAPAPTSGSTARSSRAACRPGG